jgi:hypothetical protein
MAKKCSSHAVVMSIIHIGRKQIYTKTGFSQPGLAQIDCSAIGRFQRVTILKNTLDQ